jgi:hypothetical protein
MNKRKDIMYLSLTLSPLIINNKFNGEGKKKKKKGTLDYYFISFKRIIIDCIYKKT